MTRRIPLLPTILVILAIAAMIGLGVWQLKRLHEKNALLAIYAANEALPPVALPALWPIDDKALFRRTSATCLQVSGWKTEAGHTVTGETGWSHIASCRTGAEGPGFSVDVGVSQRPEPPKEWTGGQVRGRLTWAPDGEPLITRMFAKPGPRTPLIVSEVAAPGLKPTASPDVESVPNNHLAYAVQWFLFAAVAGIVYVVALRRRTAKTVLPDGPSTSRPPEMSGDERDPPTRM